MRFKNLGSKLFKPYKCGIIALVLCGFMKNWDIILIQGFNWPIWLREKKKNFREYVVRLYVHIEDICMTVLFITWQLV